MVFGMVFGLFTKSRRDLEGRLNDPWAFGHLSDYGAVLNWMNARFAAGQPNAALDRYYRRLTQIIYQSLDRYPHLIEQLNEMAGGVYTDAGAAAHSGVKLPPSTTLFENMMGHARLARQFVDSVSGHRGDAFRSTWQSVIDNDRTYVQLLTKLVQDFGNFELLIVQLPGLGFPETPGVQPILAEMFEINKRLVRLLELIKDVHQAWQKDRPCTSFFAPSTDMGQLLKQMVLEYMLESDPQRIAHKRAYAQRIGSSFEKYRFNRAAEAYRQLSQITYGPPPKRLPKPTRHYVKVQISSPLPALCTDLKRMKWMLKEVFNNSIAATSNMMRTDGGRAVTPIERHEGEDCPHAITLRAEMFQKKVGWFKHQSWVRVTISDEGIGMAPYICNHAHLWAFSKRRADFGQRPEAASKALVIGGKGMGLAFSESLIRQHGGCMTISSHEGLGTDVIIDLPAQTALFEDSGVAA